MKPKIPTSTLPTKLRSTIRSTHTTPQLRKVVNYHDDGNRGSSSCCHTLVNNIIVSDKKREFMTGTYIFAGDDKRIAELNSFPKINILEFNLLLAVTGSHTNPATGLLTQEVSRFRNRDHIVTIMMQSFIFPSEIVSELNKVDCCQHRTHTVWFSLHVHQNGP